MKPDKLMKFHVFTWTPFASRLGTRTNGMMKRSNGANVFQKHVKPVV